jgi:serine/threonine-protein kinase
MMRRRIQKPKRLEGLQKNALPNLALKIRNPKSEGNSKSQKNQKHCKKAASPDAVWFRIFEFLISFGFRASNFGLTIEKPGMAKPFFVYFCAFCGQPDFFVRSSPIMSPGLHCRREQLQELLAESLPEAQERELSEHLASCPGCRQELEAVAAGRDWWAEAGQRLSVRGPTPSDGSRDLGSRFEDDFAHFSTDFAVDFLEPSDDSAMLGRLGEYEISEVIGRGGMGVVLKGFQKELHRHVAVKVLSPHLAASGAARRRFAREAQATAAVVHPHVMAIHSVNAAAKLPYLVMPYIPCESLQQRLDRTGPLDVVDILRIVTQAAWGLAAAHAQGLVHRDVKPANILLETNVDRVLLTDFGLARAVDDATLTRTGIIAGTPQYMSPEQAHGDPVDHRSDLFSLGGVLYAMCTGRPPFRAETTFGVLRRIRETPPRSIREINPDIPDWLERTVMQLLAKPVADRPASAESVAALLEQCLAHVQQPTAVPLPAGIGAPPSVRPTRFPRWRVRSAFVTALALALVIVGALVLPRIGKREAESRDDAAAPIANESPEPVQTNATNPPLDWNDTQAELDAAADEIEILASAMNDDLNAISQDCFPTQDRP